MADEATIRRESEALHGQDLVDALFSDLGDLAKEMNITPPETDKAKLAAYERAAAAANEESDTDGDDEPLPAPSIAASSTHQTVGSTTPKTVEEIVAEAMSVHVALLNRLGGEVETLRQTVRELTEAALASTTEVEELRQRAALAEASAADYADRAERAMERAEAAETRLAVMASEDRLGRLETLWATWGEVSPQGLIESAAALVPAPTRAPVSMPATDTTEEFILDDRPEITAPTHEISVLRPWATPVEELVLEDVVPLSERATSNRPRGTDPVGPPPAEMLIFDDGFVPLASVSVGGPGNMVAGGGGPKEQGPTGAGDVAVEEIIWD